MSEAISGATSPHVADKPDQLPNLTHNDSQQKHYEAGVDDIEPPTQHRRALTPQKQCIINCAGQCVNDDAADEQPARKFDHALSAGRQVAMDQIENDLAAIVKHEAIRKKHDPDEQND